MSCSLDRNRQRALMLCAVAGDAARKDLAALGDISLKLVDILVADLAVLATEYADFLSSAESAGFSSESAFAAFCISLISHF